MVSQISLILHKGNKPYLNTSNVMVSLQFIYGVNLLQKNLNTSNVMVSLTKIVEKTRLY